MAVPAGLLGQAAELLDLCDELLNHPGRDCIDAHVHTLISQHHPHRQSVTTIASWLHNALGATADELQERLDNQNIIVEPILRRRAPRLPTTP